MNNCTTDGCPFGSDSERTINGAKWIAQIESNVKQIQKEVDEMQDHLKEYMKETRKDVAAIRSQQNKWLGGIAVLCVVVPLLIKFMFS